MKNKFKALIAAFVGLFAFGAIAVGIKAIDSGNYYYYKNSSSLELVYSDSTAGESNVSISGGSIGNASRAVTIFDSLIPGKEAVASGNNFIKVTSGNKVTFEVTKNFIFKANVFINSSSGTVQLLDKNDEVLDTKSASGTKISVILGTDDVLVGGTYSINALSEIAIYEIYINIQSDDSESGGETPEQGYTLTYNLNGHGDAIDSVSNITAIPELPNPTATGYTFKGWYYDNETFKNEVNPGDTLASNITIYAKWTKNGTDTYISIDESINFSNGKDSNSFFVIEGSLSTSKGSVTYNGTTYDTVLKMESSTTITFNLESSAKLILVFIEDAGTCKINGNNFTAENTVLTTILESGTYSITKAGTCNLAFIRVVSISNTIKASFAAQYNATEAAKSTKLRFIATIEGISYADYKNIASIAFTFDFNGASRECNVSYVYKSIINNSGTGDYSAKENTLYAVYTLNNINKEAYNGLTLSNLQLVITYADGSSTTVAHENITLPEFTSTIAQGE